MAHFNLKQFQRAITDYDGILSLDPQDWAAYHDRGLAKMRLGRSYDAIPDFSSAIKIKKRELRQSSIYESRADAYMKTQQSDLAIRDLTTAISLQVGGSVILMNANQFRAMYPEYKLTTDDAIARKLNQLSCPVDINLVNTSFPTKRTHYKRVVGYFDCGGFIGHIPTAQFALLAYASAARSKRTQLLY